MTTLLHIDSSINGERSHSRQVTATFAQAWRSANPTGTYLYRDVAANPVPHIDDIAYSAGNTPESEHTAEQADAFKISKEIIDEVVQADVILLGAPMYNFAIPSNLKAWLDRIAIQRFFVDAATGKGELSGKKIVVATSRGGSYAPGTPRESFDHQEPYLRSFFTFLGMADDLTFLHTEMALSLVVPSLEQFRDVYDKTSAAAHDNAKLLATS
jgi:FMN-dependent NADH-azoreductase